MNWLSGTESVRRWSDGVAGSMGAGSGGCRRNSIYDNFISMSMCLSKM
jgi:hypothetical protein